MIAIITLALVGQQPGTIPSQWQDYCVRVDVKDGDTGHGGSGTIVAIDGGQATVVTARHVVERRGVVSVQWRGRTFPAAVAALARTGDLAALTFAAPPGARAINLADEPSRDAVTFGFGPGPPPGRLHVHHGDYLGRNVNVREHNAAGLPDDRYRLACHDGDSGGGVFDSGGKLCGVLYAGENGEAWAVSTLKLRKFVERVGSGNASVRPNQPGSPTLADIVKRLERIESRMSQLAGLVAAAAPVTESNASRAGAAIP